MKIIFLVFILIIKLTISYSQTVEFDNFDLKENLPEWIRPKIEGIKTGKILKVDNSLNPFYLESDFNGDKILDIAIFVTDKATNKKGILIIHGEKFDINLLGAGVMFNKIDDFIWMKVWKINRDSIANETIFSKDFNIIGNKPVTMVNCAIDVAASEQSSNLIIWDGYKYKWIHTGD